MVLLPCGSDHVLGVAAAQKLMQAVTGDAGVWSPRDSSPGVPRAPSLVGLLEDFVSEGCPLWDVCRTWPSRKRPTRDRSSPAWSCSVVPTAGSFPVRPCPSSRRCRESPCPGRCVRWWRRDLGAGPRSREGVASRSLACRLRREASLEKSPCPGSLHGAMAQHPRPARPAPRGVCRRSGYLVLCKAPSLRHV